MLRGSLGTSDRGRVWSVVAAVLVLSTTIAVADARGGNARQATTAQEHCAPLESFSRRDFPGTVKIDNRYLPFTPGNQYILEGVSNVTGEVLPHRVMFTVTDLVKKVNGVNSLVMWDLDVSDGLLVEAELAFFAQDESGNVWNHGEYPEEFGLDASGQYGFLGAPNTWIAGQEGAKAGIHMARKPRPQDGIYLQGYAPAIDFLDCAEVVDTKAEVCVPLDCYRNVVVTNETSPLDPAGGVQVKSHAPRVGIVSIGALDDPEGETLVLIARNRLSNSEMRAVRKEALELDERAYEISDVYGATSRARRVSEDKDGSDAPKEDQKTTSQSQPQQQPASQPAQRPASKCLLC